MLDAYQPVYTDPPECIEACLNCILPDCAPLHHACKLSMLGRQRKHKTSTVKTDRPQQISRSAISTAIKRTTGQTVGAWCQQHGIRPDQLHRYEWSPPLSMTPLRIKIESALNQSGITWTGHQHSTP